jgi:MoaA/NifB/PqqE/SkfB family radical SAM enzyme
MELEEKILTGVRMLRGIVLNKNNVISVEFSVTGKCNLHCKYCGFAVPPNRPGAEQKLPEKEISTGEIKAIFAILNNLNAKRINISGGEPLIREDIEEILENVFSYRFKVTLTTNGILVPGHLDVLKNLDLLVISIDGGQDTHDAIRGKGAHELALRAIDLSHKNGIRMLISSVITSMTTEQDLLFILKLCNFYNIYSILQPVVNRVFFWKPCKINEEIDRIMLPPDKLEHLLLYLRNNPYKGSVIGGDNYFKFLTDFCRKQQKGYEVPVKCMAGKMFFSIDQYGNAHPCSMRYQKLFAKRLQDYSSAEIKEIKIGLMKCVGCTCYSYMMLNNLARLDYKSIMYALRNGPI